MQDINYIKLFDDCHNLIRNNDGLTGIDAFDEMVKILFTSEKTKLSDKTSKQIQNNFSKIDLNQDIAAIMFESFLSRTFTGSLGQFFTPREVIEFIVKVSQIFLDKEPNIVLDPACGTGGFLVEALSLFKNSKIVGCDINDRVAEISRKNLAYHGSKNFEVQTQSFLLSDLKDVDLVLTNPPFGVKEDRKEILKNFTLATKSKVELDFLFIEKISKIMADGGVCGIVLPRGILNNKSLTKVRDYIRDNFVILGSVDLPQNTFKSTGTGAETSILFLKKGGAERNKVFVSVPEHIGFETKTKNADRTDKNDLPKIVDAIKHSKESDLLHFVNKEDMSDRLDSSYFFFKKKYSYLPKTIGDYASIVKRSVPKTLQKFKYIELSSVSSEFNEIFGCDLIENKSAPARAKKFLQKGDVICARLKNSTNVISSVTSEDDYVASTGFSVLNAKNSINQDVLIEILKDKNVQKQMQLLSTGTIMPTISDNDILSVRVQNVNLKMLKDKVADLEKISKMKKQIKEFYQKFRLFEN
tara:strand:+ start:74 stop:1654 length:1581 start_codon:yes stop_codon:yes gene_type:complete